MAMTAKAKATPKPYRKLAEQIAADLFDGGFYGKADRLELKYGKTVETEMPGGGWSEWCAADRIRKILAKALHPVPGKKAAKTRGE